MSASVRRLSKRLEYTIALAAVRGLGRMPQSDIDKVLWPIAAGLVVGTLRGALRETS